MTPSRHRSVRAMLLGIVLTAAVAAPLAATPDAPADRDAFDPGRLPILMPMSARLDQDAYDPQQLTGDEKTFEAAFTACAEDAGYVVARYADARAATETDASERMRELGVAAMPIDYVISYSLSTGKNAAGATWAEAKASAIEACSIDTIGRSEVSTTSGDTIARAIDDAAEQLFDEFDDAMREAWRRGFVMSVSVEATTVEASARALDVIAKQGKTLETARLGEEVVVTLRMERDITLGILSRLDDMFSKAGVRLLAAERTRHLLHLRVRPGVNSPLGRPTVDREADAREHRAISGYPEWYYTPPREPGMAFYGIGVCTHVRNVALAKQAADDRARRDIADTLQAKFAAILKSYLRSVLGPDMPDSEKEERLIQDTLMALLEAININGAEIVKRDIGKQLEDGSWPYLSLARIGFDSVAEALYKATREAVKGIQPKVEVAFDELKDLLEASQKEDGASFDSDDGDSGDRDNANPGVDMATMMLDAMASSESTYWLQMPKGAIVGLWWEYEISGMTQRWSIIAETDGGAFIVENPMDFGGTVLVQAYEVDPAVEMEFTPNKPMPVNVLNAWIGIPDKQPRERPVMDAPIYREPPNNGNAPAVVEGEETLTVSGWDIACKWMEVSGSKVWTAIAWPFEGLVIRAEYNGTVSMELAACGDDAAPQLKW